MKKTIAKKSITIMLAILILLCSLPMANASAFFETFTAEQDGVTLEVNIEKILIEQGEAFDINFKVSNKTNTDIVFYKMTDNFFTTFSFTENNQFLFLDICNVNTVEGHSTFGRLKANEEFSQTIRYLAVKHVNNQSYNGEEYWVSPIFSVDRDLMFTDQNPYLTKSNEELSVEDLELGKHLVQTTFNFYPVEEELDWSVHADFNPNDYEMKTISIDNIPIDIVAKGEGVNYGHLVNNYEEAISVTFHDVVDFGDGPIVNPEGNDKPVDIVDKDDNNTNIGTDKGENTNNVTKPDTNQKPSAQNPTYGQQSSTPNPSTGVEGVAVALAVSALALGGLLLTKKIK